MLYTVYYNSMLRLYDEVSSASHKVRHNRAAGAANRYEMDPLSCRTSQLARYSMPAFYCAWNGSADAIFKLGSLGGFKVQGESRRRQPLVAFMGSHTQLFTIVDPHNMILPRRVQESIIISEFAFLKWYKI